MGRTETGRLREGFTTGTAATAAALAALTLLMLNEAPKTVATPLPPLAAHGLQTALTLLPRDAQKLILPIAACAHGPAPELTILPDICLGSYPSAHARVRKDGGDDPDATSGALITASVFLLAPDLAADIFLDGGPGVGRATLPGLPVAVGQAAINPGPQAQIRLALKNALDAMSDLAKPRPSLAVIISVPGGEELAKRTLNPRLGITGGISILGTQGTVRPFSNAAWRATIEQGLSVAKATGCKSICLATGRRSEALLMRRYPELTAQSFIQVADFAGFSLSLAGALKPERLIWGCFFGKLAKLAQGLEYTHANETPLDMEALADLCASAGAACAPQMAACVTASHALEILLADAASGAALAAVGARAQATASRFAGCPVRLHLFHSDGRELLVLAMR